MAYDLHFTIRGNLAEVQQQLRQFGQSAATAKKQGADIGEGIKQGASGVRSAIAEIRDVLQGISRQLVESQVGVENARKAERAALADSARQLAEIKRRQAEITAEVRRRAQEEQAAAARNIANARALAAENARIAAKRADSIAAFSAATPEQLRTPAERTDAIGREQVLRRDAELRMLEINRRADALEQRLAATRGKVAGATRTATGETQRAVRATQDLNRQVALALPQLTDISVGLASGQSPFLVAIQQGGQLRDLFGGIRPAIGALGSAIVSLINPVTIAVAAIAGIGYAFLKGQEEGLRFNRILILTGNAAGKTADQLNVMADQLDSIEGVTRSSAAETLAIIAESGKFTAEQFDLVAVASEKMREATGRDIEDIVGEFEKLAESPAEAVVTLNQKYNFLTGSILEQIRVLQDQGRTQEAATIAMRAYADAVNQRTPQITENLGYIERAWRAIKNAAREAGDTILSVGRVQQGSELITELNKQRADLLDDVRAGNKAAIALDSALAQQIKGERAKINADLETARKAQAQKRATDLQAELENEARQSETAQQKRARQRISVINRTNEAVRQAEIAGDAAAADAARRARTDILADLDQKDKEDADRKAKSAASAAAAAARKSKEAAKQAANAVRAESELVKDSTQRALKELDRLYAEGAISIKDFYEQKQRLELEGIDASIRAAEAQKSAAVDIDERKQAETELIKLQRDRGEVAVRAAREQAIAERELGNEIQTLQARLDEANGKLGEQERVQLEQERAALLRKFQSNPGAQKLVNDLFDVELAKARANAINAERDKILGKLRDQTDYINAQVELGALSPVDAEAQLQAARQKSLEQLEALRKKAQEAYNEKPNDETLQALRQLDTEILQVKSSQEQLKNAAKQQATDSLTQFFTDLSTGAKSFNDAFKDLVRSFIQGLARMAAEAIAKRIIFSIFGGGNGGGLGGLFGIGTKHTGGMVGHGITRTIPAAAFPMLFAGAPRFHSGGPILAPGEVPIIAQTGERVLSRDENKRYSAMVGAASRAAATRVVNVFDRQFVPDQMDSADGERVILNIIGRNPGRVKQILG